MTISGQTKDVQQEQYKSSKFCYSLIVFAAMAVLSASGCATSPTAKLPEPPPRYIYPVEEEKSTGTVNSLWNDDGNIFEDRKASRLNDIITISIVETLSGSQKADTQTKRESSADYNVDELLGMNKDFHIQEAPLIHNFYRNGAPFSPSIKGSGKSEFKGEGDTNREGRLVATLTARVIEVLPNGNLVISGRKELTINEEKQVLVLTGTVRPDDISSDNVVLSSSLADARVYYVGDGVIQDKQKPGWLVRAVDKVWPF